MWSVHVCVAMSMYSIAIDVRKGMATYPHRKYKVVQACCNLVASLSQGYTTLLPVNYRIITLELKL